jgi:hypothetical protein
MDLRTAVSVFQELESERYGDDAEWQPPTFDVRLDAVTVRSDDSRGYRIRVTHGASTGGGVSQDDWRYVLDLAQRHGLEVDIQNAGMELR